VVESQTSKEVAEKDDDDDELEDQEAWPLGSSGDDGPIRFSRVKRWFKCPICLNNMYEHKNSVLFHIKNFITEEMGLPNMVE
jgi:hypothetical protein